ncbi:MAG: hypothetical protein AAFZ99_06595 [Pseudomonadota bacterium]
MQGTANAFAQGYVQGDQINQARRRRDTNAFLAKNAGAIMDGDPEAMQAYARYDPQNAFTMMRQRSADARAQEAHGLAMQSGRHGLEIAQAREARDVEKHFATLSEAERARDLQALKTNVTRAMTASSPQEWDAIMMEFNEPELVGRFDDREQIAAGFLDLAKVIEMQKPTAPTEAEQQIERLVGTGVDYEVAVGIVDGRYVTSQDPLTGERLVLDKATGRPVAPQVTKAPPVSQVATPITAAPGTASEEQAAPSTDPELSFGSRFDNAEDAFGVGSVFRGALNTGADVIGAPVPFPETQEAQADFSVFKEGLINTYASTYGRQPPSWLLQRIDQLAPQAGSVWEGPQKAQAKTRALIRDLEQQRDRLENGLKRRLAPKARQDIEGQISGFDAMLADLRSVLGGFAPENGKTTKTGVTWSVKP